MSPEHLVTQALFDRQVRIESDQAPLFAVPSLVTSIGQVAANILCRRHNNELGRTADWAALRLLHWLRLSRTPMVLPGSDRPRLPSPRRISGVNFGRWLCKTHCNLMIANGRVPDSDYRRYAFARPTKEKLYFLFAGVLREAVTIAEPRDAVIRYTQFVADDAPDIDAFAIRLAGFDMLVAPFEVLRDGQALLDRPRTAQWTTPLGMYQIVFDWRNDPGGGDA